MSRFTRSYDQGFYASCALCDETVSDWREKTLPEPDDSCVISRVIRLCPDCYQVRPSDAALLERERER